MPRMQLGEARRQQTEQLKGAIDAQTRAMEISLRKRDALQDMKEAVYRILTARIEEAQRHGNDELTDALEEQRRAEECLRTCEIEQLELHIAIEEASLKAMRELRQWDELSPSINVAPRVKPVS